MFLGEILIEKYGVKSVDVDKALQFQRKFGGMLGSILINMGIVNENTIVSALSEQLDVKIFGDAGEIAPGLKQLISDEGINVSFLSNRRWLPVSKDNGIIYFAATNPLDYEILQYLGNVAIDWDVYIVTETRFRELLGEWELERDANEIHSFDISDMSDVEIDRLRELASEAPVINLVNGLISRAVNQGASDLHFEPYKNMYRVRFRIDGILYDVDFFPLKMQLPIASRIKILSGMDIAERRRPQDGQISMKISSKEIDIRVSTLPLAEGESLVLRFLVKESIRYDLEALGLEKDLVQYLREDISKSAGVILLAGPTGCGKTTTLYSSLNTINSEDKKIITIEDPIEYQLDGINQIQVQPEIGYDFLDALRSILRQDPDVLMIGEIRDGETARVAMQSSLTGHLVFSTVHTNDAPTAYIRLIDLGIEDYLINSSLISVIAQRLVRKLCPYCAEQADLEPKTIASLGLDTLAERYNIRDIKVMKAKGCPACNYTGYKGRVGIMEYLRCTDEIKSMPKNSSFSSEIRAYISSKDIRTLLEDGLLKVLKGITTIEEVIRVCG